MKPAVLEGGVLTIAREALEELARRKGFDLKLSLSPAGIVAAVTVPTGILDVPAKVTLDRIRVEGTRLVGDNLAVSATFVPIPLSMLGSITSKYPFLALDTAAKKIYLDMNQVLPGYISLNIKEITILDNALLVQLNELSLEQLPVI